VCDGQGRPLLLHLTEGQRSDHIGAVAMIDALPAAATLLGDKAYDSRWFRQALAERGIMPCIPVQHNRKGRPPLDTILYRQRHRIENLFARLKDWRRIHTRYDRCAHTFLSAIAIAAAFLFWM
jgi:putative transposase